MGDLSVRAYVGVISIAGCQDIQDKELHRFQ
jgi:hypothetical protein